MLRHLALLLAAPAALLTTPVSAATVKLDVTVTSSAGNLFSAPIFTFTNLSDPGFDITGVIMSGGAPWDFVHAAGNPAPHGRVNPVGGTSTILIGEERLTDGNNGCTAAISYGLTGFNPGEYFKFATDPERPDCTSDVIDIRPFLNADQISIGVDFSNGTSLSGNDWLFELINPLGSPNADSNQLYRLQLSADLGSAVPEPATWGMMIAGFAAVGYGLRRRRAGVAFA